MKKFNSALDKYKFFLSRKQQKLGNKTKTLMQAIARQKKET